MSTEVAGKMHIGGRWVDARSGDRRPIINPATQETIAEVAEGGQQDARDAIQAARRAFDLGPWPYTSPRVRAALLAGLAGRVRKHREELAELESLDTGKTVEESRWDMDDVATVFDYFAGLADDRTDTGSKCPKQGSVPGLEGSVPFWREVLESPSPDSTSTLVREPVGVCGQIMPWNYPLLQASWKMAPALAAGCTIVMKPSEITPLTTLRITELAAGLEFPEGVINTVLGPGRTVGAELSESSDVDLISFTGGVATGKEIMRAAGNNIKKIALELGGKNPHIIFADADLGLAVDHTLNGVFFHAGQICSAGARVMVEDQLHDRFVDALQQRMKKIRLGSGFATKTQMGPLISAEHLAKIERYVAGAREEGARLLCGGARPDDPELSQGFFYLPTLFVDCHDGMRIVQEEVFGPVITVERFSTEEEAVERANSTVYGLAAGFWTADPERIGRVSRALRFGTVWANDFNVYFAQAPWGGYRQSGIGRELGRVGLEEYTEIKHIYHNRAPRSLDWFGV